MRNKATGTMVWATATAGRSVFGTVLAFTTLVLPLGGATAQSLTTGRIEGRVVDEAGLPISGAVVTVEGTETAVSWTLRAERTGRFALPLVQPGVYDVRAENLGFNPVVVRAVVVRSGEGPDLRLVLTGTNPGAVSVDTVDFSGGGGGPAPSAAWIAPVKLRRLPGEQALLGDLSRLATETGEGLESDGLPGRFTGLAFDGIPYRRALNPQLSADGQEPTFLPRSSVLHADLIQGGGDVEWSEFAGSVLSTYSPTGGNRYRAGGYLDWSGGPLGRSDAFPVEDVSHTQIRGGLTIGGPIVPDTAHFMVGVEARRLETPAPAPWSESAIGTQVEETAETAGVDLVHYLAPQTQSATTVAGFGRVSWRFSPRTLLTVRASAASNTTDDPLLGGIHSAALGSTMEALEIQTSASLSSVFSPVAWQELRIGFETSRVEYGGAGVPLTFVTDQRTLFGDDAALPGEFRRTAVRLSETVHVAAGAHSVKFGVSAQFVGHEQQFVPLGAGAFAFADPDGFQMGQGIFQQWEGSAVPTSFSTVQVGGAIQDLLRVAPGVSLLVGIRVDGERRPLSDIVLNSEWADLTGLENTALEEYGLKVSPRLGFSWRLDPAGRWAVRGEVGRYHDLLAPGVLGELVANAGQRQVRRGVGDLGAWPEVPGSSTPGTRATALTLPGPEFAAPASLRGAAGLTGQLGRGVTLRLVGAYRHTDFLVRRHDLNRRASPSFSDQYGRPVYGSLQQLGGLVAATPGSNRRFGAFDLVSALDPDGFSDRWSLTAGLDRVIGDGVRVTAQYTYSQTEDNVAWGSDLAPDDELSPFPDSLDGQDWLDGRSDFDVPHRLALGIDLPVPGISAVRLAGLYRFRSGLPFTPGFRDGVDANGDGSGRNDPAFVDDGIDGVSALLSAWPCLRRHVGDFVERNACRGPTAHALDLRLSVRIAEIGAGPAELIVEALNVLESDAVVVDRALYLIDDQASLTVDAAQNRVVVPLVVNPDFGSTLRERSLGRRARVGLRINW